MFKRLTNFKIYKKKSIILFIIVLALFNNWSIDLSYKHYNLLSSMTLSAEEQSLMDKDINTYLKSYITNIEKSDNNGFYEKNELSFYNYLLKYNIKPLNVGMDFNHIGEINGVTSLYMSIKETIPLFIPLISLILVFKSFNIDKNSYNYLMTLPIKREKICLAKLSSSLAISFFSVGFILICAYIKGTTIGGIGDINYPILLNSSNIKSQLCTTYIPMYIYIVLSLCIISLQILVYTYLGILIIAIFKNKWIQYFIGLLIGFAPVIYVFLANQPLYANITMNLIPFVNDKAFYLVTYGFSFVNILGYFIIMVFVIIGGYKSRLKIIIE
jgi:hypothetical protein